MGDMKLGENKVGPVLNECTKFHNFVPYGSRGCHRLQWERKNNNKKYSCKQQWGGQAGQMTQKKLSTSSEEGSEYRQQVWCESIKDLLR